MGAIFFHGLSFANLTGIPTPIPISRKGSAVEADVNEPERHTGDTGTGSVRPLAWVIVFAIGCLSLLFLLPQFNVF
jgi:hypothetical protein